MDKNKRPKEIPEVSLLEYQKAQDSAEHYNTMIWTLISIGIGFSLLILKVVWFEDNDSLLELISLFFGFFSLFYFSFLIESANEKKLLKYHVCKEIETQYGFIGQNFLTDKLPLSKLKLKGIDIIRIIKFLLFFFYFGSVLVTGIVAISESGSYLSLISLVCVLFASIGAIAMEVYYLFKRLNINQIIKNNNK